MDNIFNYAIEKTLAHEGGYVNDPKDPGGETKFGISKRSYPDLDILSLTREHAIEIYRKDFWWKHGYDKIELPEVAAKAFDFGVNMGPKRANRMLQMAVNESSPSKVVTDGIIGPVSVKAVNEHWHPDYLLTRLQLLAIGYYLRLNNRWFLSGWIKRALD